MNIITAISTDVMGVHNPIFTSNWKFPVSQHWHSDDIKLQQQRETSSLIYTIAPTYMYELPRACACVKCRVKQSFLSVCWSVGLSVCRSVSLSVCQSVSLSFCQSVSLPVCRSVSLLVCQFVGLSVCPFVSLSVCRSVSLLVCRSVSLTWKVSSRHLEVESSGKKAAQTLLVENKKVFSEN